MRPAIVVAPEWTIQSAAWTNWTKVSRVAQSTMVRSGPVTGSCSHSRAAIRPWRRCSRTSASFVTKGRLVENSNGNGLPISTPYSHNALMWLTTASLGRTRSAARSQMTKVRGRSAQTYTLRKSRRNRFPLRTARETPCNCAKARVNGRSRRRAGTGSAEGIHTRSPRTRANAATVPRRVENQPPCVTLGTRALPPPFEALRMTPTPEPSHQASKVGDWRSGQVASQRKSLAEIAARTTAKPRSMTIGTSADDGPSPRTMVSSMPSLRWRSGKTRPIA